MKNPWKNISLSDYENHMSSNDVKQLQALNDVMKVQLNEYSVEIVMVLGIAGGNGLDYVNENKIKKIYGIDINSNYLYECKKRYKKLGNILQCICTDLINKNIDLPIADMLIANLIVEYIGYENFIRIIKIVSPQYISCVLQENKGESFISQSPYMNIFRELNSVHHFIDDSELIKLLENNGYILICKSNYELPNQKN